jgi:hypothetical protein
LSHEAHVDWQQSPNGVVIAGHSDTHFLVSAVSGVRQGRNLLRVQVEGFAIVQEWVDFESNLLAISHAVSLEFIVLVYSFDMQNCSSASMNMGLASSASVCLIMRGNFVRHIKNEGGFSTLAFKHDTIVKSNTSVLAESMWDILQTLGKFLLCMVDDKLTCFLLSHVLLELNFVHFPVLSPVSNSGLVVVLWTS